MKVVSTIIFLSLGLVVQVNAQSDAATVSGTVTTAEGDPIAGAAVAAHSALTGETYTTVSEEGGNYRLENLAPGAYELSAAREGFERQAFAGIQLAPSGQLRLNFALEASAAAASPESASRWPRGALALSIAGAVVLLLLYRGASKLFPKQGPA